MESNCSCVEQDVKLYSLTEMLCSRRSVTFCLWPGTDWTATVCLGTVYVRVCFLTGEMRTSQLCQVIIKSLVLVFWITN